MSDLIRRRDVIRIIEGRFSGLMIGDILRKDVEELPAAAVSTGDRISRAELFDRLAVISAEDANGMKAQIYAAIQAMDPAPVRTGSWEIREAPDTAPGCSRRYYCSECGEWNTYGASEYCPRCGAYMKSEPEACTEMCWLARIAPAGELLCETCQRRRVPE